MAEVLLCLFSSSVLERQCWHMQVYAVTCERDHRLAMQAFSPQLRLLGFGLTKGVEQPRAFPSRHARLYLLCLFSLTVLCKHSEEFHSDFFFWTRTRQQLAFAAVLLCTRNVLICALKASTLPQCLQIEKEKKNHKNIYLQTEITKMFQCSLTCLSMSR